MAAVPDIIVDGGLEKPVTVQGAGWTLGPLVVNIPE